MLKSITFLDRKALSNEVDNTHITFLYEPKTVDTSLFGSPVCFSVIGYGKNADNEGLLVQIKSDIPQIKAMIPLISVPHITLSVSEIGKERNTRYLDFLPIREIPLKGIFGGYKYTGEVVVS